MTELRAPKVSCLMPVYNAEQYLEEALRSIAEQTFEDWELVVVNDGSSDRSLEIIRAFAQADQRVVVVEQANAGVVGALNNGLQRCRGEYVARMDADDFSFKSRFSDQVGYLDTHPGCVCVGGLATQFNDPAAPGYTTTGGRHRMTNLSAFPPKVAVSMHPLIMVRRADLDAVGGYRAEYIHAEDYDLFVRLSERGTIDNPHVPMLFYRRHEGQISVKHVELQERSAARAEVDGFKRATGKTIPDVTVSAYEQLRSWRRYIPARAPQAKTMLPRMAWNMIRPLPIQTWTREYARIRLMIAVNMVRVARKAVVGRF